MSIKILKPSDRQALRDWELFYTTFLSAVVVTDEETPEEQKKRIAKLENNFEEWKKYYFPNYCYSDSPAFHKASSKRILENPEWVEVRPWARELAKDALCMFETIYQVLTKVKRNIILVSNSFDKAEKLITPYRISLEINERINNDYGTQKMPGSWQSADFTTVAGASFIAVGAGQSPRGTRNEEVRPDKIIISDIDTDEDCRNPETITKRWEWYERALYPTRSVSKPFQVVFLGNIIAKDCCIKRAMKKADYARIVNLEDKNGASTWPEKNTPEHIARIKSNISTGAYQQEYCNNPLREGKIFKELVWGKVPPLTSFKRLIAYSDPATSNKDRSQSKGKTSFKALFLMGEKNGLFYVIHGFLNQVSNAEFTTWFFDMRDRIANKVQLNFYIENNSLQDPFFEQVFKPLFFQQGKERGFIPLSPDDRKKPDKFVRIEGNLEPLHRNGQLIFNAAERNNPHFQTLEEQFKLFDEALKSPADGPDCIEGGFYLLNQSINNNPADIVNTPRGATKKY